ncbi:MAG: putative DNA binding domain-containing protein [Candidatus Kaiserbacteria bacterium]|nr:putative DNA binding domain-containing protein [Candidatus Kaiserbacteria bacterium]
MEGKLTQRHILEIPEESNEIEFKRVGGNDSSVVGNILKTVVAMANTNGGVIVLGVDDPEKTKLKGVERVFGVEENKENFDEVMRGLSKITPVPTVISDEVVASNGKTIVVLRISKAVDSFCSRDDKVFTRLSKSNKELNLQEIIKFNYAKGFIKAGEELIDDVDIGLLETDHYRGWVKKNTLDPDSEGIAYVLKSKGLAKKDEETNVLKPTRSAVMLFAEYPTNLMDTKCAVKVAVYTTNTEVFSTTPNFVGVPKIIQGPMIKIIQDTQEYVLEVLNAGIGMSGSGFRTKSKLPERVITEGITNAVIHRDYHAKQDIEIKIFPNRVEVINPGLFPFNITKGNIGEENAGQYRNDSLVKTLREFPEPPNLDRNEGVRAMRNQMKKNNLYPPVFVTYPDLDKRSVKLVLKTEERTAEWEKVQEYLEREKSVDNKTARKITGITSAVKMSRMLGGWATEGLLEKISPVGSKKGTLYILPSKKII